VEFVAARREIGGMTGEQRDRMDQTLAAEELAEGQWFWNEPNPLQSRAVQAAAYNWAFVGALTRDRDYPIPRGRIMGGSSAFNACYFVRGRPADFD
jgi:choline dehydrogenase-like flavoprotein